jgi:phospholipid-translocating ATPase
VSNSFSSYFTSIDVSLEEEYDGWIQKYRDATVAMDDREGKIEAASNEIEQDLRLLGATAIEDRLQDGVPETIEDLKIAGIKIWVATGDKLETAIGRFSYINIVYISLIYLSAIGHSTNLIASDSNMIIIRGGDNVRPVYAQMVDAVKEFFPESDVLAKAEVLENVVEDQTPSPSDPNNGSFPLTRVNSGAASIVGSDNGKRSGGFVLVLDGLALTQVPFLFCIL